MEHDHAVSHYVEGIAATAGEASLHSTEAKRNSGEGHVPFQRTAATTRRQPSNAATAALGTPMATDKSHPVAAPPAKDITSDSMVEGENSRWRMRLRSPWACSLYTLATTLLGFAALFLMVQSFMTRQLDTKGCEMSYMRPIFHKFNDFDTEHTRFASKYSLYLYREGGIDEDSRVRRGITGVLGELIECRSKACQCSSFLEMPVATSKYGQWAQKLHTTTTML